MTPALGRGVRKAVRTFLQMAAAGSLTALVTLLSGGLDPELAAGLMVVWQVVVTFLHNYLETAGKIPVILPSPGLVTKKPGAVVDKVTATVDAVVQSDGDIVGDLVDTTGHVVGGVTGLLSGAKPKQSPPKKS